MDRKTMRKYIEQEEWNRSPEDAARRSSVLDLLKCVIEGRIEDDPKRKRKQPHTAKRTDERLCEEHGKRGFSCSYRSVAGYVAARSRELYQKIYAALPLEHRYGGA